MDHLISEEISQFLPWLENFERAANLYYGQFDIDDAVLAQILRIKADLDSSVQQLNQVEAATWDAGREVSLAEAELLEVEKRHAEAEMALSLVLEEKAHVFYDAALRVRPIAAQVLRSDEKPVSARGDAPDSGNSLLGSMKTPISSGSQVRLIAPGNLVVSPQVNRVNVLQWEASGNDPDTQYVIEAAVGSVYRGVASEPDKAAYKLVDTVSKTTVYSHSVGRVPVGTRVKYRLRAKCKSLTSGHSNEFIVTCK